MSATGSTVVCEPIPGREVQGTVLDELPRSDGPESMLRVDVGVGVYRIPEEECR